MRTGALLAAGCALAVAVVNVLSLAALRAAATAAALRAAAEATAKCLNRAVNAVL